MQKTTKSLLTKIFVLLTVIFCVFALALGAIGCAKEEEAKTVASMVVNGNVITVTYTDGSTEKLTVEGEKQEPAKECGHDSYIDVSGGVIPIFWMVEDIADIPEDACGMKLMACTVCDHLYAEYIEHKLEEEKVVEPTCTEYGYDGMGCVNEYDGVVCPYVKGEKIDPLNHVKDGVSMYEKVTSISGCYDPAVQAYVCSECGDVDEKGEDGRTAPTIIPCPEEGNHMADQTWTVDVHPSATATGKITGTCTVCGEDEAVITLPMVSAANGYEFDVPGCEEGKTVKTTTLKNYRGYTYKLEEDHFEKHYVTVDGEKFYFEENGTYTYTQLGLSADMFSGNEIPDCETPTIAMVKCEACQKNRGVFATGEHKYNAEPDKDAEGNVITMAPDCTNKGYSAKYTCTANPDHVKYVEIPATGHTLEVNGDFVYGANDTVTIPVKCTKCDDAIPAITGTIAEKADATCEERAYIKVKYTLNGAEVTTDKIYSGELAKHYVTVNGAKFNFEENGTYTYLQLGLTADVFSGEEIPDCETPTIAMVKCEACQKNRGVFATGEHKYNAEPDKDSEGNVITLAPDCTNKGYSAKYTCTANPDHVKYVEIPATGHTLEVNGAFVYGANDTVTIPVKCTKCDDTIPAITGTIVEKADATCEERAYVKVKYTLNGAEVTTDKIYSGELAKHYVTVNGEKFNFEENGTYTYLQLGLTADVFSGEEIPDCKTPTIAMVKCEACQKNRGVFATGEHKYAAEPDKNAAGEVITKEANCTEDGYTAIYTCTAGCGTTHVKEADVIKATGHTWELVEGSEVANSDGTVTLTVKCACGAGDTIKGIKNEELSTPATCGKDAVNVYDYEINGEAATIEVVMTGTAGEHSAQPSELLEFEATDEAGKVYICKGYVCENCKTLIIVSAELKPAA